MNWRNIKLGEVLKQYRIEHWVQDELTYKQVTISKYDGVSYRGEKTGSSIGRKRQFLIDLKKYPNTLLFIRQGVQDGGIGLAPKEVDGCIVTENMPVFSIEGINPDYLEFFINSPIFKQKVNELVPVGSAQKALHERELLKIEAPLPSSSEQNKIVKKIKTFYEKQNNIEKEIEQQLTHLKQLRQSILQEAVQGKLLAKANNEILSFYPPSKDGGNELPLASELPLALASGTNKQSPLGFSPTESAQELLKKIKAEKQKLIAAGKLKKEKELSPIIEDEIPFELPKGWAWCRWNDLLSFDKYPMKRGPFGSSLKKEMFGDKGIRVFEQYNPINDDPYWARYYINEKQYKELEAFTAIPGDLLISCSGATLGRITEIPKDAEFGIINQALLKLTLNKKVISNAYFLMLFRSPFLQQKILDEAGGSAIPNMVGVSILKQVLIPLPPLSEQQRILIKVQQLLQMVNQLEQQVAYSQTQASNLLQAVLKEAFSFSTEASAKGGNKGKLYEENEMITMAAEE